MGKSAQNPDRYKGKVLLAPMVKVGTLPARLLSLRYGADLVYTEEIIDWRILKATRVVNEMLGTIEYVDESDGTIVFSTCAEEKDKMVFQVGTSDPERALKVMKILENDISSIDVNMGCPKEFSLKGGMGAALLKKPEKVKAILTTLVDNAKIPVTCKIRVLSTIEDTLELALMIQSCGVSALAIHGRNVNERPQHANRNHFIKAIAEKLDIPVIANGGSKEIKTYSDIEKFREAAGASSVMLARAAEWNLSVFRKDGKEHSDKVIAEYLKLCVLTDNPFSQTKYTIQGMLKDRQETPFGKKFLATSIMEELCELWDLQDFYQEKKTEFDTFKKTKRPSDSDPDSAFNGSDPKKLKLDRPIDSSTIVVPDCVFIRGHYENEALPKSILLKWSQVERFNRMPKYTTELIDKKFISAVEIGGKKFMTDVWEKNKKHAEQGAALAAVRFLNLTTEK